MAKPRPVAHVDVAPDARRLTQIQAARLAALSSVSAKTLEGLTIAEVGEKLRWAPIRRLRITVSCTATAAMA